MSRAVEWLGVACTLAVAHMYMNRTSSLLQTLAFLLPVLTMALVRLEVRVQEASHHDDFGPEAVIVSPSRELAMQIVRTAQSLLPQQAWPLVQQAIGGANMRRQLDNIESKKPLVVVGTPGRLAELSRLGALRTHRTSMLVLDEVDQLLCSQFQADLLRVLQHMGTKLEKGPQAVCACLTLAQCRQWDSIALSYRGREDCLHRPALGGARLHCCAGGWTALTLTRPWRESCLHHTTGSGPAVVIILLIARARVHSIASSKPTPPAHWECLMHLHSLRSKAVCCLQVVASATMNLSMVATLQKLLNTSAPIPIVSPHNLPATASSPASASSDQGADSSAAAESSGKAAWGWGAASGFWAGYAGVSSRRGSAGGINTGGPVSDSMPPRLQHCYIVENRRHHVDVLRRVVHALGAKRVLAFMNHQDRLRDAAQKLAHRGLEVGVLHGEMGKQKRSAVLTKFLLGKFQVVLVSDVVARGLDVPECDAVVHLELPTNAAHYAHRAGRTGRMGRPGVVVSVIEKREQFVIDKLSKSLGVAIPQSKVTGGRATIIEKGRVKVLGRFQSEATSTEGEDGHGAEDSRAAALAQAEAQQNACKVAPLWAAANAGMFAHAGDNGTAGMEHQEAQRLLQLTAR